MSPEEKQELDILEIFINRDSDIQNGKELDNVFKDLLGNTTTKKIQELVSRGLIDNYTPKGDWQDRAYAITKLGRKKYCYLWRKMIWQPFKGLAFWITFIAAVVSAYFAAYPVERSWTNDGVAPKSDSNQVQTLTPLHQPQKQQLPTDTNKKKFSAKHK